MNVIFMFFFIYITTAQLQSAESNLPAQLSQFSYTDTELKTKPPVSPLYAPGTHVRAYRSLPTSPLAWPPTHAHRLEKTPEVIAEQNQTTMSLFNNEDICYPFPSPRFAQEPTFTRIDIHYKSEVFEKAIKDFDNNIKTYCILLGTLTKMTLYAAERIKIPHLNDSIGALIRAHRNKYKRLFRESSYRSPDIIDTNDPLRIYPAREEAMATPWFLINAIRILDGHNTQKKIAIRHATINIISGFLSDTGRPSFIQKVAPFCKETQQYLRLPAKAHAKKILLNAMHDELLFVIKNYIHTYDSKPTVVAHWAEDFYEDFCRARPETAQNMWLFNTITFTGTTKDEKRLEEKKRAREEYREKNKKTKEEIQEILKKEKKFTQLPRTKLILSGEAREMEPLDDNESY
ncbi:MAG: hypothetical protein WCE21_02750 [Candidatus Babeliales bacterium]